jgi:hypothetical protein
MSARLSALLVVCCSTFAFGQPAVDEARRLFGDGEFARALKVVDTALPGAKDATHAAKLLLVRGQCLLALGQADKAAAAFTAALKKDLASELDVATASPQAIELLEKARAALPALVSIAVVNGEASVRVDDKPVGPAPLTVELGDGLHVIQASARDGRVAKAEVEVRAGRRVEVNLLLERAPVVTPAPGPAVQASVDPAAAPKTVAQPAPKSVARPTPESVTPPSPKPVAPPAVAQASPESVAQPSPDLKRGVQSAPAPLVEPPPAPPIVSTPAERPRSKLGWIPVAGGAVLAGAGGVSLWQANVRYQLLTGRSTLTPAQERDAMQTGPLLQTLGWVGVGVGAAAVATGVVLLALPSGDAPAVSALVMPGGAFVGVAGRFP